MNTDKLSTGGASPSAESKKREGEKRKSPCTPLREKGKGKEDKRGSLSEPSFARARTRRAGMRARLRASLDADLDVAVRAFNGTADDRRIWASIAWRVGVEEFHHALINKLAEDSADNAPRRPAATFQAFLNARFPKPETVLDENTSACSKPSRDAGVKPCPEFIEALAKPLDGGATQVSFALRLGHDQAKRLCDWRQRRNTGLSVWDLNRSGRLQAWHVWRSGRNRRQGSLSRRLVRRGA